MEIKKIIIKIKFIIFLFRTLLKYFLKGPRRYLNLFFFIILKKPKTILEIGVYRGDRSIEMIKVSKIFSENINYYGFDLFEDFYEEKNILEKELSKVPDNYEKIKKKIDLVADNKLFKGYTHNTLPKFVENYDNSKIDFIFIDGGHSIETIKNDWINIEKIIHKDSIVIFDDYYLENSDLVQKFGCNFIYNKYKSSEDYNVKLLSFSDSFIENNVAKHIKMIKLEKLK